MNTLAAIDLLLALLSRAQVISGMVAKAQAEGRDSLTTEEWDSIIDEDDHARAELAAAIAKAKSEGR